MGWKPGALGRLQSVLLKRFGGRARTPLRAAINSRCSRIFILARVSCSCAENQRRYFIPRAAAGPIHEAVGDDVRSL
jgi:hypothetical protein